MLGKLLVYFLCISLIAFIYVYKIPIFCSACEKPTGVAASIFRCILDEEKLCNTHTEIKAVGERMTNFLTWVKDIVVNDIPDTVFKELQKIFGFLNVFKDLIKGIGTKIGEAFRIIKEQVINKITTLFTDLTKNLTDIFTEISNGVKNFGKLMYQSIDNIRNNLVIKVNEVNTFIQNKIKTEIINPINDKVITPVKDGFVKIGAFFSGLVDAIISPFKDLFDKIGDACIPGFTILPKFTIFPRVDLINAGPLEIPELKVPQFCPFVEIKNLFNTIKNAITTAFDRILSPVTTAIEAIKNSFNQLENIITNGINTVKTELQNKFTEIKNYIIGAFEPIRVFLTNLGDQLSTKFNEAYTFIKEKLNNIKDKIITFLSDAFSRMWSEIKQILRPIIDLFIGIWNSFFEVYKNFIKGLNEVYKEVKKQWDIVYNFIKDKLLYAFVVIWMAWIDWALWFLPVSQTVKVNLVNGGLLVGLMGIVIYYYNIVANVVATSLNGVLTVLGDLYGIIGMIFPTIQAGTDIVYTILGMLPTLTYAMDFFAFISPARIIPNILQQAIDLAEVFVGGARDIVLTPYFIAVFITVLVLGIVVGIHNYMTSTSLIGRMMSNLPPLPEKVKMFTIKTDNIEKKIKTSKQPNVVEKAIDQDMGGAMGEFQQKIRNFKRRVQLIEEVRKEFEYNPNDPNKLLEMNLDNMRRRLDERIAAEGI